MKYNYKKASEVFERFYNLCCDPWTLGSDEKQQERRNFMRALTRDYKEDKEMYVNYIKEEKECVCVPVEGVKSRMWDFDLMREYDSIIDAIVSFQN